MDPQRSKRSESEKIRICTLKNVDQEFKYYSGSGSGCKCIGKIGYPDPDILIIILI